MWKLQPPSETLKHHHPIFNFCSGERRSSDCGVTAAATAQTYASSRWCPTPEQLRALEEFYKRGIRTPSTYQIQQITAQLRRFGRIEGKNVFYWFQNHKARERQRIRRRLSSGMQDHVLRSFEGKSPKDVENMQNKSWASNATLQEGVSIARTDTSEGEKNGWIVQQLLVDREISSLHHHHHNNNNNGISPCRQSHVNIHHPHSSISSNENWQFEVPKISGRRPERTLELFPIHCDEKANEDPVQFYEFL